MIPSRGPSVDGHRRKGRVEKVSAEKGRERYHRWLCADTSAVFPLKMADRG